MLGKYLEQVNSPSDLKKIPVKELPVYAREVRDYINETVTRRGGHLSSNLGSVELTIALHYVFSAPKDKILFDVGHQSYTHKIITGRREGFYNLRSDEGVSGFPNVSESEYDAFTMGHSSTSLSVGLGLARSRKITGDDYNVVSLIGDGAFTGGMAFEALNDIGENKEKMIIVLNDNKMSISKNVGAFSQYLAKLRLSRKYNSFKHTVKNGVRALPFIGEGLVGVLDKMKDNIKMSLINGKIFENLGVKYYGPVDGHDISGLIEILKKLKTARGPVLLHVVTKKGNGVVEAENNPDKYHGVGGGKKAENKPFSKIVGQKLCELAEKHDNIVAVTAAMSVGTGLENFANAFPDRFYDVGIAEGHAVTMCAGLSASGVKPYFAVYSSFLQRGFDQILHDVCIDKRPVTFLIDHAGVVGGDGVTHQGIFDISYLSLMPNMTILQPKDGKELAKMLEFSVGYNAPLAIRYPKDYESEIEDYEVDLLSWSTVKKCDTGITVLAVGNRALSLALGTENATVINARVIKPLDEETLSALKSEKLIITIEDGVIKGGFGEAVKNFYGETGPVVVTLGHEDAFPLSMSESKMFEKSGLTKENLVKIIKKYM